MPVLKKIIKQRQTAKKRTIQMKKIPKKRITTCQTNISIIIITSISYKTASLIIRSIQIK